MRAVLLFCLSLAGSVALTALQVVLSPTLPFWRWALSIGIGVFSACCVVILIHWLKPGGKPIIYIGMVVGISFFVVCLVGLYVAPVDGKGPAEKQKFSWILDALTPEQTNELVSK